VSGQLHGPAALPSEIAHGTLWIGGWVDHRAGLDDVEKRTFFTLPGLELRPPGRPARSQSLHTALFRLIELPVHRAVTK
jgi:hypothetical protein